MVKKMSECCCEYCYCQKLTPEEWLEREIREIRYKILRLLGKTIYMPKDYLTLAAAIEAAKEGDMIFLGEEI
jgi:hypothetical protein